MATGMEHYAEAERLADAYDESHAIVLDAVKSGSTVTTQIAIAQQQAALTAAHVHATLALVAAQAEAHPRSEWREAIT